MFLEIIPASSKLRTQVKCLTLERRSGLEIRESRVGLWKWVILLLTHSYFKLVLLTVGCFGCWCVVLGAGWAVGGILMAHFSARFFVVVVSLFWGSHNSQSNQ